MNNSEHAPRRAQGSNKYKKGEGNVMENSDRWLNLVVILGLLAGTASAQFQMSAPPMRGIWNPVVGAGAAYLTEDKENRMEMEMAIVGTETVGGKPGHWLEMWVKDPRAGETVMKQLYVLDGNQMGIKRVIVQTRGQPPFELPVEMMGHAGKQAQTADFRKDAELVGTESVTTPAGTFSCQHYRGKQEAMDIWVADKVSPWGLVKATSKDFRMTLVRVVRDAQSRIQGTPQKFDPAEMMRRQRP